MKLTRINLNKENRILRAGLGKHEGSWFARLDLWWFGLRLTPSSGDTPTIILTRDEVVKHMCEVAPTTHTGSLHVDETIWELGPLEKISLFVPIGNWQTGEEWSIYYNTSSSTEIFHMTAEEAEAYSKSENLNWEFDNVDKH